MIDTLESGRLTLRKLSKEHCTSRYVSWMNDPEVNRYMESGGNYSLEKLDSYLTGVEARPDMLFWAIHLKETGEHIGNIKIDPIDLKHGRGEYGIMMGDKSQWSKGFAKEASRLVIDYCFNGPLRLRKITLGVLAAHEGGVKLYEKLGFQTEGILKSHYRFEDAYQDVYRMALFNPALEL